MEPFERDLCYFFLAAAEVRLAGALAAAGFFAAAGLAAALARVVVAFAGAALAAACRFYADRLFSPERRSILESELAGVDDTAARERDAERQRQQKLLSTIARQQDSIMRQAREGDPDDPFTRGLRQSYNELEGQKAAPLAAIAKLDAADADQPAGPTAADVERIEALPYLALNLYKAPPELLYELFEVTRLSIDVHGPGDEVTITVRLPSDQLPKTARTAERISDAMSPSTPKSPPDLSQADLSVSCWYPRPGTNSIHALRYRL